MALGLDGAGLIVITVGAAASFLTIFSAGSFLDHFPLAHFMALGFDNLTLAQQFTALCAVGIAGVAFLGAAGFLCIANYGVVMLTHLLRCTVGNLQQECRPYLIARVAKRQRLAGHCFMIQSQLIEFAGNTGISREVQIAIFAHDHGA